MEKRSKQHNEQSEYNQLKVRMKSDFKLIRRAVKKGALPDVELARTFRSEAHLMTEFPDKGDENYPQFRDVVDKLATAVEVGDRATLADAVAAMHRMKKECHRRFK